MNERVNIFRSVLFFRRKVYDNFFVFFMVNVNVLCRCYRWLGYCLGNRDGCFIFFCLFGDVALFM